MKAPRSGSLGSQELLSFDGPLMVNNGFHYDEKEAKEAALHRIHRRGELALTPRTQGFRRQTNLWVPHTGFENRAVIYTPTRILRDAEHYARQRVVEKYEDTDVPDYRFMAWAAYARRMAGKKSVETFDRLRTAARENYRRINTGFGPNGEIERDRVETTSWAIGTVAVYLASLRVFVGSDAEVLGKGDRRKWSQANWKNINAERLAHAREVLDAMPDWDFDLTVKEAYWAERSRYEYWTRMENLRRAMGKAAQRDLNAEPIKVPIEAYDDDPRAYAENYLGGEFIDS